MNYEEIDMPSLEEEDDDSFVVLNFNRSSVTIANDDFDVKELSNIVESAQSEINALHGLDVVLLIGKTGVGKSSLIQLLNGVRMERSGQDGNVSYVPITSERVLEDFKIGDTKRSQTKMVKSFHHGESNLVFCDLPGYKDTHNYLVDIATSVWINQIARVCKSLRLIFLIHGATLEDERGGPFRKLLEQFATLTNGKAKEIRHGIVFCFTHMSNLFPEERDESILLKYIDGVIRDIAQETTDENVRLLMSIICTCISKKSQHVRVLNPVATDIPGFLNYIRNKVIPIENPKSIIQCALSRSVKLSVDFALTKLETTIRDGLISSLREKQQELPDLVHRYFVCVSILQAPSLISPASKLLLQLIEEYNRCKEFVLQIVDSSIKGQYNGESVSNEEVGQAISMYNKLKFLIQIFEKEREVANQFCNEDVQLHLVTISEQDIERIELEFYRRCLLTKIYIAGEIASAVDFTFLIQQLENLKALTSLDKHIGHKDDHYAPLMPLPDVVEQFYNILRQGIPIQLTQNCPVDQFLVTCHLNLCKNIPAEYKYLFDLCFAHFSDLLRLVNPEQITNEVLSNIMESYKQDLHEQVHFAIISLRQKSAEDLALDFEQHISSLQDALGSIISQETILRRNDMDKFYQDMQRIQSYLALCGTRSNSILTRIKNTEACFGKLDSQFNNYLSVTTCEVRSMIFKDEFTNRFLLLANKIDLLQFNATAQVLLPTTFKGLESLRQEIKSCAVLTLQELKSRKDKALKNENFVDLRPVLETLKIGDEQLTNLFSDYDSIHRDYTELLDMINQSIEAISSTLLHEVRTPPFTSSDYQQLFGRKHNSLLSSLKEELEGQAVIDCHGYYNRNWNGNLSFSDPFPPQLRKGIQRIIAAKLSEYDDHQIHINSILEKQLKQLCDLIWFDEFRRSETISAGYCSISSTLRLIVEGCRWGFCALEKKLRQLTSSVTSEYRSIQDCIVNLLAIQKFSKIVSDDLDVSFVIELLENWMKLRCDSLECNLSKIVDAASCALLFPYEEVKQFTELKMECDELMKTHFPMHHLFDCLSSTVKKVKDLYRQFVVDPCSVSSILSQDTELVLNILRCQDSFCKHQLAVLEEFAAQILSYPERLKGEIDELKGQIESLVSAKTDFSLMEEKLAVLQRCSVYDEFLKKDLIKSHTFLFGQYLSLQSKVQEEFKERIVRYDFTNLRTYLEKCNVPENPSIYEKYSELMNLINPLLKKLLQDSQSIIWDGPEISKCFETLNKVWIDLGGHEGKFDHIMNFCKLDLHAEISRLNDLVSHYIDKELSKLKHFKGHELETAVEAANTLIIYNRSFAREQVGNELKRFVSDLKSYFLLDEVTKSKKNREEGSNLKDDSLSKKFLQLVYSMSAQRTVDSDFTIAKLSNILDQMKKLKNTSKALCHELEECVNYDSWVRHILTTFQRLFDDIASEAFKSDTYATALNIMKAAQSSFSESFLSHFEDGVFRLKKRIADMESKLEEYNNSKKSAFETIEGCLRLKATLDRFKNKATSEWYRPSSILGPSLAEVEYRDKVQYYQGLADHLYVLLESSLRDHNWDLAHQKFVALESVHDTLYMHFNIPLREVDALVTRYFRELLQSLIETLNAQDLGLFSQRFVGFYFYRKLLGDSKLSIDKSIVDDTAAMHNALSSIIDSCRLEFETMCSEFKFDNSLNLVNSLKSIIACRSMSTFPNLSQISSRVLSLHAEIIKQVEDSVLNHEYFKLRHISESLRSFHLLSELGGGSDLIEKTKASVQDIIRGSLDALRKVVTECWTKQEWSKLNESIKILEEAENELKHFNSFIDMSLLYNMKRDLEKKLSEIGDQAIEIASTKHGEDGLFEFILKFAELGQIYELVQEFHHIARSQINRVLYACRDQRGLHFIQKLGVQLEKGEVFQQLDDPELGVRIGRRLVVDFNHFKDVATMTWNKRVAQFPVSESLAKLESYTYNQSTKAKTNNSIDQPKLQSLFEDYSNKYEKLLAKYLPNETDKSEIVKEVLDLVSSVPSCSLNNWDESTKNLIPQILAGIFAYYTVTKCGESFNSLGDNDNQEDAINARDILITPHNIQILTILMLLNCGDSSKSLINHLMQIGTGEGKSIILGALATIFGIFKFSVRCVCYSEYLSSRDYDDFKEIFEAFGCLDKIVYSKITTFSEDSVAKQGNIRYLTQQLIMNKNLSQQSEDERRESNGNRNLTNRDILLIDEVDVFFGKDFYGQTYNQVTTLSTPEIVSLIKMIWNNRANKPTLSVLSQSKEYQTLISQFPNWKFLIDNELKLMCSQVNSFDQPPYEYNSYLDKVGYSDHDSISYSKSYGYRTVFAYLREYDKGNIKQQYLSQFDHNHLHMQISCGQFSYANINPACVLGVSGTLTKLTDYENQVMSKYNINKYSIAPSVYGAKDLVFDYPDTGVTICPTKADYFKAIVDIINQVSRTSDASRKKHRAIIVFFENFDRLEEFRTSEFFRQVIENTAVNRLSESTPKDARDYIIKVASTSGQVTLATKAFGRGTDFISRDNALNERGGTHILQTFLSEMLSEEIQVQGRTSRQGQKGSYGMVLLLEDTLIEGKNNSKIPKRDTLAHFDITESEMSSQARADRYSYLCEMRSRKRELEAQVIEKNLVVANERDDLTRRYFTALLSKQSDAIDLFQDLYHALKGTSSYQTGFHVVFMLDESGSMEGPKFQELRDAYALFVRQHCNNEDSSNDLMTVINFSSSARYIAKTVPFTSAPSLPFQGGNTRFRPALDLADAALQEAADRELAPVLILMTDGQCGDYSATEEKLNSIDSTYSESNLQVYLVAFGSDADVSTLDRLQADKPNRHVRSAEIGNLSATFKEIQESLMIAEYYAG